MKKQRIFLGVAIAFFLILFYASYDIATRTTFPGSKGQLKERINKTFLEKDTIRSDRTDSLKKR